MSVLFREVKTAVLATIVLAVLLGGVFPAVIWAGGQLFFHDAANGRLLVEGNGSVRGSALLGQRFTSAKYFHSRPSAAGTGYDGANSSGTNLGPTSRKLADAIQAAVASYRKENSLPTNVAVPADAVTSSASGLDPHISLANAALQAPRVARARQLPLNRVRELIHANTDGRDLHIFGAPGVNVLTLNIALDALTLPHAGQEPSRETEHDQPTTTENAG